MKFMHLLIYRWFCTFISQSHYHPDEYYQTMEFAHGLQFGYGVATWENDAKLRSCLYPSFISYLFALLEWMQWDNPTTLYVIAYATQGFITALGDYLLLKLVRREFGDRAYRWSTFFLLTNWYYIFTGNRALTNTIEMSLLQIAYYFYPWNEKHKGAWLYKVIGVLSFWIRPTGLVFYFVLILFHVYRFPKDFLKSLIFSIPSSIFVIAVGLYNDFWCYEEFTVTPYNFLYYNVVQQESAIFGVHSFGFYIFWCFPFLLTICAIPTIIVLANNILGWMKTPLTTEKILVANTVFALFVLSLNPHKEERFILPLVPTCLILSGVLVARTLACMESSSFYKYLKSLKTIVVSTILVSNSVYILYFGYWSMAAMSYGMRNLANELQAHENPSLLMLMRCFQFRMYSQIHKQMPLKYLDCSEERNFYMNPTQWLSWYYDMVPGAENDTHILIMDNFVYPHLDKFVESKGFTGDMTFLMNTPPAGHRDLRVASLILRKHYIS